MLGALEASTIPSVDHQHTSSPALLSMQAVELRCGSAMAKRELEAGTGRGTAFRNRMPSDDCFYILSADHGFLILGPLGSRHKKQSGRRRLIELYGEQFLMVPLFFLHPGIPGPNDASGPNFHTPIFQTDRERQYTQPHSSCEHSNPVSTHRVVPLSARKAIFSESKRRQRQRGNARKSRLRTSTQNPEIHEIHIHIDISL